MTNQNHNDDMTREHLIVTLYGAATWCLTLALMIRGCWLLDTPNLAIIDIAVGIVAFRCHCFLQRYERFADEY
jgi:hypothetical protein